MNPQHAETVALRAPYTLAEIETKIASHDYNAELLLRHAMLLLRAESAEQLAVPDGWTDDQMIRFGWLCLSGLSIKDKSLAERLEIFREHEALRGAAAPAAQQAAPSNPQLRDGGDRGG